MAHPSTMGSCQTKGIALRLTLLKYANSNANCPPMRRHIASGSFFYKGSCLTEGFSLRLTLPKHAKTCPTKGKALRLIN